MCLMESITSKTNLLYTALLLFTQIVKGQNGWYTKQGCKLDWYPSIKVLTAVVNSGSPSVPYASCLAFQGIVAACSVCKSYGVTATSLCQLVCCFGLLQPLLYSAYLQCMMG